jgi:integrase
MGRGDGRFFMRGSRWWIQYSFRGEQQREPARVLDRKLGRLRPAKDEKEAKRALEARRTEKAGGRFIGLQAERVTVNELLDAYVSHQRSAEIRSLDKLLFHIKPIRAYFGAWRASEVTTFAVESYQQGRREAGRAAATIRRELECLRGAFNYAAEQAPPRYPKHLVPTIPMPPVDNVRTGYFERADIEALLQHVSDPDLTDFIEWSFRTGMRRGEISKLTWEMLDRSGSMWVLRIPGTITKNKAGRSFGFDGAARAIIERRLKSRRLDCPLVFHRAGGPVGHFYGPWKTALKAANLPPGLIFHDLRRSAVRTLIRSGVDPSVAMKVSGHKTRSMLDRYNIIEETETAAALAKADAYLSTQPTTRPVVALTANQGSGRSGETRGQFGDNRSLTSDAAWCRRWDLNPH